MTPAARVAAAITVLDDILTGRSAEQALSHWARGSRFAGSKDRAALRDLVFDALRQRASCAARGGGLHGRGLMLGLGISNKWALDTIFSGQGHAPAPLNDAEIALTASSSDLGDAVGHDLPAWLWAAFQADLGDAATSSAQALRQRAPLYLRVNRGRGSTKEAISGLEAEGITTNPHPTQPGCLEVTSLPRRVKLSVPYTTGLVDIQDAASQMAVASLDIPNGARVLDYCAGGGGKSLAIADQFDCEVTAHDVATARMGDIPTRAERAGVEIAVRDAATLQDAGLFDVVVVDAPCTGSGTWRRNPEAKWHLTPEKLQNFSVLQGDVLASAATHVKDGGRIYYMTCSVLRAENDAVIDAFLSTHPRYQATSALRLQPGSASDGFFCQALAVQPLLV